MLTLLEFLLKKHIDLDPDAVDLGLPSGTLWCSHNVGADKPEERGDYFAWGEIRPKKEYNLETYMLGTRDNCTKYNEKDNKTELDLEDDAAHVNMGGDWHMPTLDQILELKNYTINEWTLLNKVYGSLFTSKKNCRSIFIPAAGFYDGIRLCDYGDVARVWSSSSVSPIISHQRYALFIYFSQGYMNSCSSNGRYYGLSVRGVIDKK